jgi:hypothetical protein
VSARTLREDAIGKSFGPWTAGATAEKIAAAGDVPLLYAAVLAEEGCAWPLADASVSSSPVARWLPGALEVQLGEAQLRAGDWITTVARVADVLGGPAGEEILVVDAASQNEHGELLAQARCTYRVGAPPMAIVPPEPTDLKKTQPILFDFVKPAQVEAPPGHRPGDPLPRVTPLRSAVPSLMADQRGRLVRLSVRYLSEIFVGQTLVCHGRRKRAGTSGRTTIEFETILRKGGPVLGDGVAELIE